MPFLTTRKQFDLKPLFNRRVRLQGRCEYYDPDTGVTVAVPDGFEFDLASYPRIARPFFDELDHTPRSSCIHDYLHDLAREGKAPVSRRHADRIYRQASIEDGEGRVSAYIQWLGLRLGGWRHW